MSEFQRAVLVILARSEGALGWYQIERRLSNVSIRERSDLLGTLAVLRERGLVEEVHASADPRSRYVLTPAGQAAVLDSAD